MVGILRKNSVWENFDKIWKSFGGNFEKCLTNLGDILQEIRQF